MKILVLDDSLLSRKRLMAKLSRDHGVEKVRGAGDLLEAIQLIREEKPDLVMVDWRAHRRYGIDILKNIKAMSPSPKVMMLTSWFSREGRKCPTEGVDFSFDKFTEIDKVMRTIRSCQNTRQSSPDAGMLNGGEDAVTPLERLFPLPSSTRHIP